MCVCWCVCAARAFVLRVGRPLGWPWDWRSAAAGIRPTAASLGVLSAQKSCFVVGRSLSTESCSSRARVRIVRVLAGEWALGGRLSRERLTRRTLSSSFPFAFARRVRFAREPLTLFCSNRLRLCSRAANERRLPAQSRRSRSLATPLQARQSQRCRCLPVAPSRAE